MNFIDLNKACPKDSYLLPRIGHLLDDISVHALLSFMDAFLGYHQIYLHEPDQEKTTFIIERGLYCYKMLLFSLKNVRATYQSLVNRVFES